MTDPPPTLTDPPPPTRHPTPPPTPPSQPPLGQTRKRRDHQGSRPKLLVCFASHVHLGRIQSKHTCAQKRLPLRCQIIWRQPRRPYRLQNRAEPPQSVRIFRADSRGYPGHRKVRRPGLLNLSHSAWCFLFTFWIDRANTSAGVELLSTARRQRSESISRLHPAKGNRTASVFNLGCGCTLLLGSRLTPMGIKEMKTFCKSYFLDEMVSGSFFEASHVIHLISCFGQKSPPAANPEPFPVGQRVSDVPMRKPQNLEKLNATQSLPCSSPTSHRWLVQTSVRVRNLRFNPSDHKLNQPSCLATQPKRKKKLVRGLHVRWNNLVPI